MRIEQGLFKAMILKSLTESGEMNSQEIFDYIRKVPYSYQSDAVNHDAVLYTGSIEALRVELVYLRKHGFIAKINKRRLLIYKLTALGKQDVKSPFKIKEMFEERIQEAVEERLKGIEVPAVISNTQHIIEGSPDRFEKIEMGSILYLGVNNEVGINVSDDPTKSKFVTLKVTNGEVTLS